MIDRRLYVVWFGGNRALSVDRARCLRSILKNAGVLVTIITEDNLDYFKKDDFYEGFEYLNASHKADYLRCYILHHYGGGYTDIKYTDYNLEPYYTLLENSDKDIIGYKDKSDIPPYLSDEIYEYGWENLIGSGMFICKPNTPFTRTWLFEKINPYLDEVLDELKSNPGTYSPLAIRGGIYKGEYNPDKYGYYPFDWNSQWGRWFYETIYENRDRHMQGLPQLLSDGLGPPYR